MPKESLKNLLNKHGRRTTQPATENSGSPKAETNPVDKIVDAKEKEQNSGSSHSNISHEAHTGPHQISGEHTNHEQAHGSHMQDLHIHHSSASNNHTVKQSLQSLPQGQHAHKQDETHMSHNPSIQTHNSHIHNVPNTESSVKKRVISGKNARKLFMDVPVEHKFRVANGEEINNLIELLGKLEVMPDEIFRHHVNEHKNDFSNWIRDIFSDRELADMLAGIKDRRRMIDALKGWLKEMDEGHMLVEEEVFQLPGFKLKQEPLKPDTAFIKVSAGKVPETPKPEAKPKDRFVLKPGRIIPDKKFLKKHMREGAMLNPFAFQKEHRQAFVLKGKPLEADTHFLKVYTRSDMSSNMPSGSGKQASSLVDVSDNTSTDPPAPIHNQISGHEKTVDRVLDGFGYGQTDDLDSLRKQINDSRRTQAGQQGNVSANLHQYLLSEEEKRRLRVLTEMQKLQDAENQLNLRLKQVKVYENELLAKEKEIIRREEIIRQRRELLQGHLASRV